MPVQDVCCSGGCCVVVVCHCGNDVDGVDGRMVMGDGKAVGNCGVEWI